MRKGRDGEKKTGKKNRKKKREKTDGNSGHYVVCQQSTARTPTAGTPHARANFQVSPKRIISFFLALRVLYTSKDVLSSSGSAFYQHHLTAKLLTAGIVSFQRACAVNIRMANRVLKNVETILSV